MDKPGNGKNQGTIRLVPHALGSYFRMVRRDRTRTTELIGEGIGVGSGIILNATDLEGSDDLLEAVSTARAETILDPMAVELSTPGGSHRRGVGELPWASSEIQVPATFTPRFVSEFSRKIAEAAVDAEVTAVMAPSHFLETLPSPWLDVDRRLVVELRHALDTLGAREVAIYYPLVLSLANVGRGAAMIYLVRFLHLLAREGAIDALTLRVHGFGVGSSGPTKLRKYIDLARSLHTVGLPILAEKTGTLGLGLLGFGVVGAIESGLTINETCDLRSYMKPRGEGGGFMPPPRVYLEQMGAFLKKDIAQHFLKQGPLRHYHVCQDECCHGASGMFEDPRRHFVLQRSREVAELAQAPPDVRRDIYMRRLARAVDLASKAIEAESSLRTHAKRLVEWQRGFSEQRVSDKYTSDLGYARAPGGRWKVTPPGTLVASRSMTQEDPDIIPLRHHPAP